MGKDGPELVVTIVNVSPEELPGWDTNLYEVSLQVDAGETEAFTLDNLPDSFRYDRHVAAYGVNGGVERVDKHDVPHHRRGAARPAAPLVLGRRRGSRAGLRVHHSRRRTPSRRCAPSSRPPSGGVPSTGPRPRWTGVRTRSGGPTGCARRPAGRPRGTPTRWRGWPAGSACSRPTKRSGARSSWPIAHSMWHRRSDTPAGGRSSSASWSATSHRSWTRPPTGSAMWWTRSGSPRAEGRPKPISSMC